MGTLRNAKKYFLSCGRRDGKVFISNAKAQNALVKKLIPRLRDQGIRYFHYTDIEAIPIGTPDWKKAVHREIRESEIFVAFLSQEYMDSEYCEMELEDAIALHDLGKIRIHPYLVEQMKWPEEKLRLIQGKDVSEILRDDTWVNIVIDRIIEHLEKPFEQEEPEMIQTDVDRLIKTVEKLKNFMYELESRKTDITNARAKLDKVTQRIQFENYTDQIAELDKTIEEQQKEMYTKREELLSLVLGESGRIELVISKIEENLPKLSPIQVDDFFSHVVQLQTSLEEKGLPIPTELIGVKSIAEKKDVSSDEEKRAKIKFSLSLLGPKVEVEKEIADPDVRDILRKFWNKAKELALKEVF